MVKTRIGAFVLIPLSWIFSACKPCDEPPHNYIHDRCPTMLDESDRVSLLPNPLTVDVPFAAAGDDEIRRNALFRVLHKEKGLVRPTDYISATIVVRRCDQNSEDVAGMPTSCQSVGRDIDEENKKDGGNEVEWCPDQMAGIEPTVPNDIVTVMPVDDSCTARIDTSLDCVATSGRFTFDVVTIPAPYPRLPSYFLALESGDECRIAPLVVRRDIPDDASVAFYPDATVVGGRFCSDDEDCFHALVGSSTIRCNDVHFECNERVIASRIRLVLEDASGLPVVSSMVTPVLLELEGAKPAPAARASFAVWLSADGSCPREGTVGRFKLEQGQGDVFLCSNGASGEVTLSATLPTSDGSERGRSSVKFSVEARPSQLRLTRGGVPNAYTLTAWSCDGLLASDVPLHVSIDPPKTPSTLPDVTSMDGTATLSVDLSIGTNAIVSVGLPDSGATCNFTIAGE